MSYNAFDDLSDKLIEKTKATVHAKVSDSEEFDDSQVILEITKVINGDKRVLGNPFWVNKADVEEGHSNYTVELEVSYYSNTSTTNIEYFKITPA